MGWRAIDNPASQPSMVTQLRRLRNPPDECPAREKTGLLACLRPIENVVSRHTIMVTQGKREGISLETRLSTRKVVEPRIRTRVAVVSTGRQSCRDKRGGLEETSRSITLGVYCHHGPLKLEWLVQEGG